MITNAIEHGNLGISFEEKNKAIQEGRLAELIAEQGAGERCRRPRRCASPRGCPPTVFEITIRDDGRGFDWRTLPAVEPENLLAFNGRGIFLTKIYFDEVIYNDTGNEVTLRKRKPRSASAEAPQTSRSDAAFGVALRLAPLPSRACLDEVVRLQVRGDLDGALDEARLLLLDHDLQHGIALVRVHLPVLDGQRIVRRRCPTRRRSSPV